MSSAAERIGPFILGSTLGEGATGKVKLAVHKDTGQRVAIKIIQKSKLTATPSLRKKIEREIAVMKLFSHPHVIKLFDVLQTKQYLFIILEHVEGGELFDYIVQKGRLSLEEAFRFFKQIILGVEYCHNLFICHRDLKPENLLLDKHKNIKIADFGMAGLMREEGSSMEKLCETSCGSPHYASPEVVKGEKYNGMQADVWSIGVILYALLTGRLPFDDENIQKLLAKVKNGQYMMPSFLPEDVKDLISRMLCVNPNDRITIHEIKKHSWWKKMNKLEKAQAAAAQVSVQPLAPPAPVVLSSPDHPKPAQKQGSSSAIAQHVAAQIANGEHSPSSKSGSHSGEPSSPGAHRPRSPSVASGSSGSRPRSLSVSPAIQINAVNAEIVDLEAEEYPIELQQELAYNNPDSAENDEADNQDDEEEVEYVDDDHDDEYDQSEVHQAAADAAAVAAAHEALPSQHAGDNQADGGDDHEATTPVSSGSSKAAVVIERVNPPQVEEQLSALSLQLQNGDDSMAQPQSPIGNEPSTPSSALPQQATPRKMMKPTIHKPIAPEEIDPEIIKALHNMGWKDEEKLREALTRKKTKLETVLYRMLVQRKKELGSAGLMASVGSIHPELSVTPANPLTAHVDNATVLKQRLNELKQNRHHEQQQQAELSASPKKAAWFAFWRKKPAATKKDDASTFGLHSSKTQQAIINELARSFKVLNISFTRISESTIRAKFAESIEIPVEFDISMTALPKESGFLLNFSRVAGDALTARVLFDVLQQELSL